MPPFGKLLIANRGEIAVRIARTAHALGYRTVAVYSDVDRNAPHVAACDEAIGIGGAAAAESYLSIAKIVDAAVRTGADAVHPGYGFLSENADFADACAAAGIVFIGPPASAIRAMGNKSAAKAAMIAAGVPCIPGFAGEQELARFAEAAREIGYPVMLKAAAGGGGKGMRLVRDGADLEAAFAATRSEAERAFGAGQLLLEKALEGARHIEIQVFADAHGAIVHLGERDCSIQRRHQKIVEEAPSPAVSESLREAMGRAAIDAARAVGYVGAGTIEFLLASDGAFYFLEMNTRLQVEHAVTEATRGMDLVAWQLRVASGDALASLRSDNVPAGHAIEVRLYAEDPAHGFLPQAGAIATWRAPSGTGIRVDAALADGLTISPYYDPMLAKIVASGDDREEARRRLIRALEELTLFGIVTNRAFLIAALEHPTFVRGAATTDFIGSGDEPRIASDAPDVAARALAAVLLATPAVAGRLAGWQSRGVGAVPMKLRIGDETSVASISAEIDGAFSVTIGERRVSVTVVEHDDGRVRATCDGVTRTARVAWSGTTLHLQLGRVAFDAIDASFAPPAGRAASERGAATSPMPGIVASVSVAVGDEVVLGQTLVVLEAMKMLHEISAGAPGRVANVLVAPGQQVGMRALLVEIVAVSETKGALA